MNACLNIPYPITMINDRNDNKVYALKQRKRMSRFMICSYCKTESKNQTTCDFCCADLTKSRPKRNPMLDDSAANYTQPELETMHTYDLIRLLSHIRHERSESYQLMQIIRKTPEKAKISNYEDTNEFGQEQYRELTAKKNVIEQILVDRMGYFPKRIDDKLLAALDYKIKRSQD